MCIADPSFPYFKDVPLLSTNMKERLNRDSGLDVDAPQEKRQDLKCILQEEKNHSYLDNLTKAGQSHSMFKQMPNGLATNPAHCREYLKRLHLPLHLCASDYNQ